MNCSVPNVIVIVQKEEARWLMLINGEFFQIHIEPGGFTVDIALNSKVFFSEIAEAIDFVDEMVYIGRNINAPITWN